MQDMIKTIRNRNNNAFYRDDEVIDYLLDALQEAHNRIVRLKIDIEDSGTIWSNRLQQSQGRERDRNEQVNKLLKTNSDRVETINSLTDRERVLREALQFYADHQNWFSCKDCVNEIENDEGEIARNALEDGK